MSNYLNAFETSVLDQTDLELAVDDNIAAVATVRQSLVNVRSSGIRMSHPEQRYRVWITDDGKVLVPDQASDHIITTKRNRVSVTAERPQMAATIGVRVIRQLIMRGGEARGGRTVHAGAVNIDGEGVLIGGSPGAGKTGVLTRLAEDHGARPVANDRTMLIPAGNSSWYAVGVPLAWRFTPEAVSDSPRLAEALVSRRLYRGCDLVDGKVELTPLEAGQMLGNPVVATTRITRVAILVRLPGRRPSMPDAAFVRRHMDFGASDHFADDWLDIRPLLAGRAAEPHNEDAWWSKLAASVPIQVVSWTDPTELSQVAAAVSGARP